MYHLITWLVMLFLAIDWNALLAAVLPVLQVVLPGLIVTLVTGLVKKYGPAIPGKYITILVVPVITLVMTIVAGLTTDANVIWTFVLGLVATFFFELKKQVTAPPV